MISNLIMLAWYGGGGVIGNTLAQWEEAGFFSYVLPFLLLFALIFGILSQMKLFKENKGANGIIALAVALLSLQFDIVPRFFSEIFPRFGVGLAVLLIALILFGMFLPTGPVWILFGIGAIIFIVVLVQTFGSVGWSSGYWFNQNWPNIIIAALVITAVVAVWIGTGKEKESKGNDSILSQLIRGGK